MKRKVLFFVLTALVAGGTFAQQGKDTVSYPDGRYFYPPLDTTIAELLESDGFHQFGLHCAAYGYLGYLQYKALQPRIIYGIAVTPIELDRGPKFFRTYHGAPSHYGHPLEPDPPDVDSSLLDIYAVLIQQEDTQFVRVDSVKWHQREPDRYFRYRTAYTLSPPYYVNELVMPVFEFFFDTPYMVHDSFYVGFRSDYVMSPEFLKDWRTDYPLYHYPQQWGWRLGGMEHRCDAETWNTYVRTWLNEGWKSDYSGFGPVIRTTNLWGGIFPIIVPPDTDAVVSIPVQGFHRTEDYEGCPAFVWDRLAVHETYEFGYGPADQDPDDYMIVTTTMAAMILRDSTLDSTVVYAARCRASSHHACAIHDTTVWGEWTDTVQFRLSTATPHGGEGIAPTERREAMFALSPNPTTGKVTVEIHLPQSLRSNTADMGGSLIIVRDVAGHEVLHRMVPTVQAAVEIDLSHLPAGTYFVTLSTAKSTATRRLVVE